MKPSWLGSKAVRALLATPAFRLFTGPPITVDGNVLDPQAQLIVRLARHLSKPASIAEERAQHNRAVTMFTPRPLPMARVEDVVLETSAGPLRARVFVPRGADAPSPALVYIPAGGWMFGTLDTHDSLCRAFAAEARVVVIAFEYRLAPEHCFPAAVEDVVAAFRAIVATAPRWGIDPAAIAIGGDSAGGNLAAVVAHATKHDAIRPLFQLLIYPSVDMTMSHRSIETAPAGLLLDRAKVLDHTTRYLGQRGERRDPRASPLWSPSFAGLPPAIVATAGFDPLRDEGDAYAAKLAAAGVPVEHLRYPTLPHGFLSIAGGVRSAREALTELAAAVARTARHHSA